MKSPAKTSTLILAAVLAAAFVLRIFPLYRESFAGDETFTLGVVSQPWGQALRAVEQDAVTPPFHVLLLKAWRSLVGTRLASLRLFSLLCGLTVVLMTVILGRMIFPDKRVSLLAGALVAFNEWQVLTSFYVRHYSLYAALVLLLLICLERAFREAESVRPWLAFAAVAGVLVYTHYIGWLFILGTLPAVLFAGRAKSLWRWGVSCFVTFLLFLPWLVVEFPMVKARGLRMGMDWVPQAKVSSFLDTMAIFGGKPFWKGGIFLPLLISTILIAAAGVGLFKASRVSTGSRERRGAFLLGGAALLVPILLLLICIPPLSLPYWGNRHLVPAQAPFALLLSFGLFSLARRSRAVAALGIFVLLCLQLIPTLDGVLRFRLDPYNKVAAFLIRENKDARAVFVMPKFGIGWLNYYLDPGNQARDFPAGHKLRSKLPGLFWLIYKPAVEEDVVRLRCLLKAGYSVQDMKSFMKRSSDLNGLRLVLLQKQSR